MTEMSLNDFYRSILLSCKLEALEDGAIVVRQKNNTPVPVHVGKKKLVLPTNDRLRDPAEDEIFFHPLSEQITRAESEVFQFIRRMALLRLSTCVSTIGFALLKLQEKPELQRQMKVEQQDFIKDLVDTDKNSALNWSKFCVSFIEADAVNTNNWPIHIFIRRNGEFDGKNYRRVASVSFPAFENIANGGRITKGLGSDEKDVFRNKDYAMFQQMAEMLFPGYASTKMTDFNSGYDGTIAPYLTSFFMSYKLIGERLNYILDLFKDMFIANNTGDAVEEFRVSFEWADFFLTKEGQEALGKLTRKVPSLPGNIGTVDGKEQEIETPEPTRIKEERLTPSREIKETPPKETHTPKEAVKEEKVTTKEYETKEHQRLAEEAERKRQEYLEDERRWKERKEERRQREEEYRERDRRDREEEEEEDRRRRDDRRDRLDDPPWEDRQEKKPAEGKTSFSSILSKNRSLDNDDYDDRRRDDRDSRYRDRDYRDDRRDRYSRDRDYYDRRDDRDRGYRDDRDDRYRDRDRGYRDDRDRRYGRRERYRC